MSRTNSGPEVIERPNDYDWRQMRKLRDELAQALRQVNWMLEPERSNEDRALRAMSVRYDAARAQRLARNCHFRFYKHLGWEIEEWMR